MRAKKAKPGYRQTRRADLRKVVNDPTGGQRNFALIEERKAASAFQLLPRRRVGPCVRPSGSGQAPPLENRLREGVPRARLGAAGVVKPRPYKIHGVGADLVSARARRARSSRAPTNSAPARSNRRRDQKVNVLVIDHCFGCGIRAEATCPLGWAVTAIRSSSPRKSRILSWIDQPILPSRNLRL